LDQPSIIPGTGKPERSFDTFLTADCPSLAISISPLILPETARENSELDSPNPSLDRYPVSFGLFASDDPLTWPPEFSGMRRNAT
jgi:hypothetical protein